MNTRFLDNVLSVGDLDDDTLSKIAELLGESDFDLLKPTVASMQIRIEGDHSTVSYGKRKRVETRKLLAVLSKDQVSDADDQ